MRFCRAILALLLVVTVSRSAEITTLKGDTIKADEIVSVDDQKLVYKIGEKKIEKKMEEVVKIDYREPEKAPTDKNFSQVELTDGTVVLVSSWSIKKKDFEMKLLAGPSVKMSKDLIANVLNKAHVAEFQREWKTRVFNTRGKEALVLVTGKTDDGKPVISNLVCTLGDGDEKGETITGSLVVGEEVKKTTQNLADIHGIIFKNTLPAKAPRISCRLLDTIQDLVMVASVSAGEDGGIVVTTPAGAKMTFKSDQIASMDYASGKLDYLSQLTPANMKITPSQFEVGEAKNRWFIYKDTNLKNNPIRMAGTRFKHGLTLLPDVELEYQLGGNYLEFSATIGIDDETNAEGEVTLVIEGDGREMANVPIVYKTEKGKNGEAKKPVRPSKKVTLNIKNVQKLKVMLKAKDELSGLSISVSLGDAKVNK